MNIGESLPRNAQRFGHKLAVIDGTKSLTFLELHARTNRLGNYLLKQGIKKGDVIGLSCGSRAEHLEVLFALAKIGAIGLPYDYHWSAQECEAMLSFFVPKGLVIEKRPETEALCAMAKNNLEPNRFLTIGAQRVDDSVMYEQVLDYEDSEDPPVDVKGTDPFLIMITSGTTGFPKACIVNHETYSLRSINYAMTRGFKHHERALFTLPIHFNAGRGSAMSLIYLGGTVFIEERFSETCFFETIEREKITYTMLVPALCERLLQSDRLHRYDTTSLSFLGITGGHLSNDSAQLLMDKLGVAVYESYASTDCGQITLLSPDDRFNRPDSVGVPIWCVLLRVADEDGRPVATGREGEICVRTPLAIQGYYQNSKATEEFFRHGWCHTGDIGFLDGQGYLYISGRKKNMVKSGSISLFPEEIEEMLRGHTHVADVAVVGIKSAEWGEALKAFIVLKEWAQCDVNCLTNFCKGAMASYKVPKTFEIVCSLPRTELGKIDRAKLAAMSSSF